MKTYITGVWSRVRGIQSGAFTHSSRICKGSQAGWHLKTKCSSSTHPVTLSMTCGRDAQLVMDRVCKPGIVWWYKCYSQFDYSTLQKHYPQLQNSKNHPEDTNDNSYCFPTYDSFLHWLRKEGHGIVLWKYL